MRNKKLLFLAVGFIYIFVSLPLSGHQSQAVNTDEQRLLQVMHSISSHKLFDYVKELASEKYAGRLTGTEEYNEAARWVSSFFEKWGIAPAGDNNTYFQAFPIAYTLVFKGC